jgi:hypothetical protein
MTALHDFIRAAASYYGLPQDQLNEGSDIDTSRGDIEVVLRIALSSADVTAIGKRMEVLRVEAESDARVAAQQAQQAAQDAPSDAELREEYNALSLAERSRYGSFARFRASYGAGDPYVSANVGDLPGKTTPEYVVLSVPSDKVELPTVVWLDRSEVTEQQKAMAIGVDEKGRYGVDPQDLTELQRKMLTMDGKMP